MPTLQNNEETSDLERTECENECQMHKERGKNKKGGSAPHEIIVQRLAAEPDNKQTYKPMQPREFVNFEYEDLTLANLKKACAAHFNLPPSTCDVLV